MDNKNEDFTIEWTKSVNGYISDVRITRGKALYRMPWWRRWFTPWTFWRVRFPTDNKRKKFLLCENIDNLKPLP